VDLFASYASSNWILIAMVKWIMACVTTPQMVVLINGSSAPFFKPSRGLCQGCPLSPYLFLLVAEGLRRWIMDAKSRRVLRGIQIGRRISLTHLLFVDDIFLFCYGSDWEIRKMLDILTLYCLGTGMEINKMKSMAYSNALKAHVMRGLRDLIPYQWGKLEEGLKYLGFIINPNNYKKEDWQWLVGKVEKRINLWCNRLLSRAGRLILVKLVLEVLLHKL
jgi:hypothetical protein